MSDLGKYVVVVAAAVALGGCEGATVFNLDGTEFEQREAEANALMDEIAALEPTAAEDMPAGDASYLGYVLVDTNIAGNPDTLVGDVALTADFNAPSVNGTMDNFESDATGDVVGELVLFDSDIIENAFDAGIDGVLTINTVDYLFDGGVIGIFKGNEAAAVEGVLGGDVFDGGDVGDFTGSFAAE